EQNDLPSRWQVDKNFTICELGFGTGLNFLLAVDKWNKHTKNSWLNFISIENEPLSKSDLNKSLSRWDSLSKFKEQLLNKYPLLVPGFHRLLFPEFRTALTLCLGDAKEELQQIEAQVDAWFLDGFSPAKNPEIWEENIYNQMARLSTTNTSFATFTSAGHVRRNLMAVGFNVSKVKGYGGKRECLKGKFCQQSSNRNTKHRNSKPWLAFTNIKKSHPESIAVIGSGIAGTSSARALATRGFNVTLFETEKTIASGASGNPLAILQPYPMAARNQLGIFLEKGFLFAKQLLGEDENLQKNISRHKFGALQLITSDRLKRVSEEFSNLNVIPELTSIVTAEDASKISETKINSAAFFHPLAEAVNPQELCAANITKNVSICYNTEVKCMKREENSWELSLGNGDKKYFHTVIICNSYLAYKFLQLENFKLNQIKGELAF
ncbi:MAG: tRNA (5-methylaminomethyl-2-thiouridine)(34)-methyltransferase MnmD, partial [Bdellovibrionales bacterium]|nr:tRNA (5-methylaminomethyl-2-thiouridine)(34)-methyltransferase MnmD [Bdellovibrionales bacterium]